ncbi:hypothetical protein EV174_006948, partial [Coemansia sp. RSA 2320]
APARKRQGRGLPGSNAPGRAVCGGFGIQGADRVLPRRPADGARVPARHGYGVLGLAAVAGGGAHVAAVRGHAARPVDLGSVLHGAGQRRDQRDQIAGDGGVGGRADVAGGASARRRAQGVPVRDVDGHGGVHAGVRGGAVRQRRARQRRDIGRRVRVCAARAAGRGARAMRVPGRRARVPRARGRRVPVPHVQGGVRGGARGGHHVRVAGDSGHGRAACARRRGGGVRGAACAGARGGGAVVRCVRDGGGKRRR